MNILSKIINLVKSNQYHIFLALCISFISLISYNLGRSDALEKSPLKISENNDRNWKTGESSLRADVYSATKAQQDTSQPQPTKQLDTRVVVSKNSNKYHYAWCVGAKRIKEENKIWFSSAQEAESGGYTLAGNCQK